VGLWQVGHAQALLRVIVMIAALAVVGAMADVPIFAAGLLVSVIWLALIRSTRNVLRVTQTFPELVRLPVLRWLLR